MHKSVAHIIFYLAILVVISFIFLGLAVPTPFDPISIDPGSIGATRPGINGHFLGTDIFGRDILSGLIAGTKVSLSVAFLSVSIALLLAYIFAIFTSYFGNDGLSWNRWHLVLYLFILTLLGFLLFVGFSWWMGFTPKILLWLFSGFCLALIISRIPIGQANKTINLPLDRIGIKTYEIFNALPKLILLILLLGLNERNTISWFCFVVGLMMWPVFYRYIRLEIIKTKSTEQFLGYTNSGLEHWRIILFHIVPRSFRVIESPLIFSFGTVILLEAALSFLGMGLGEDYVSWGSILAQARNNISAWWLAFYPILCIFLIIFSIHIIARRSELISTR